MARLRPGRCYREIKKPAYTRAARRVQKKNFIGSIPPIRIRKFDMGNPHNNYDYTIAIVSKGPVQIRQEALEAARINANNVISKRIEKKGYFMRVVPYPHHILRENKMLTGAGADRMQTGMGSKPFGKTIGRAARVSKGEMVLFAKIFEKDLDVVKKAFLRARNKLPGDYEIVVSKLENQDTGAAA